MLDQYANLVNQPATWEQSENTLCESRIARERNSLIDVFARTRIGSSLQRANWDGVLFWLAVACGFVMGALLDASATLAGIFELHGGCR